MIALDIVGMVCYYSSNKGEKTNNTKTKGEKMEQFKKAFEAVKKAMDSKTMVDCGTGDTEPIWHFENEICRWLNGEPYRELDASGWEMYSSMSES